MVTLPYRKGKNSACRLIQSLLNKEEQKMKKYNSKEKKIQNISEVDHIHVDDLRVCSHCNDYMIEGYVDTHSLKYYCSDVCLDACMTEEEQKESYEADVLYYTEWHDSDIYIVFDKQFATLQDADLMRKIHNDTTSYIEVKGIDLDKAVYRMVENKPVEVDELTFIKVA